uniref:Uncharacterized protein n=1 Tax=Caenorhabditis japonica TaxID=281687 RepID=A0A8R1ID65_CAEJA
MEVYQLDRTFAGYANMAPRAFTDAIDHYPNRNISVWQTFDNSMYQLRTLPEPSSWNGIPPASPAIQYMVAKTDVVFKKHHLSPVVCSQAGIILSQEQSEFVRTLMETQTNGINANAPPGVDNT